jgi:hypothetical protein
MRILNKSFLYPFFLSPFPLPDWLLVVGCQKVLVTTIDYQPSTSKHLKQSII